MATKETVPTIATCSQACVKDFKHLVALDEDIWAEDQMARFKIWATNLGVFASGHASIEHRLRDNSEIYNLILQLLLTLRANLRYCRSARDLDMVTGTLTYSHYSKRPN